jgi:MarR family transcriptional regulator, transcriptional regulator for hemolysin
MTQAGNGSEVDETANFSLSQIDESLECEFGIWTHSSLGKPIATLYRHQCTYLDHMLAPHGVTAAHVPLLGHLWAGGAGDTQNQIAQELGVDKATVSRSVAYLVRSGFAVQSVSPRDARAFTVELTDAGRELCAPVGAVLRDWTAAVTDDMDSEEIEAIIEQLSKMIARANQLLVATGLRLANGDQAPNYQTEAETRTP